MPKEKSLVFNLIHDITAIALQLLFNHFQVKYIDGSPDQGFNPFIIRSPSFRQTDKLIN